MSAIEIRRTDDDFQQRIDTVATLLDSQGIVHATYAAEMSAHKILALDARKIEAVCVGLEPAGIGEPVEDRYTLWVIDSWRSGAGWLARAGFHDVGYLSSPDHLLEGWKEVDAVAIAEFINRVEIARGADWGFDSEEMFEQMRQRVADASTDFGPRAEAR